MKKLNAMCNDDRFEIIKETKDYIIEATNIETSPEEMAVLDSICFRLWQLGLTKRNKDKLRSLLVEPSLIHCVQEWKDRKYNVDNSNGIYICNESNSSIHIKYNDNDKLCVDISGTYTYEEHQLISRTVKAYKIAKEGFNRA